MLENSLEATATRKLRELSRIENRWQHTLPTNVLMRQALLATAISAYSAVIAAWRNRRQQRLLIQAHLLREMVRRRKPIPLPKSKLRIVPVCDRLEGDFPCNFRFSKDQFATLLDAYHLPPFVLTRRRLKVDRWDALGIVLRRLAFPGPWTVHEEFFGRRERTLREIFYKVLQSMFDQCKDRLQRPSRSFLTDERMLAYCDAVHRKCGIYRHVFGFIDGTVYQVSRLSGDPVWQRSIYNGHKQYHGFKFQGINTPDGLIQFMHGPFVGKEHDTTILDKSGVISVLKREFALPAHRLVGDRAENGSHYVLFGDPGDICIVIRQLLHFIMTHRLCCCVQAMHSRCRRCCKHHSCTHLAFGTCLRISGVSIRRCRGSESQQSGCFVISRVYGRTCGHSRDLE